MFYNFSYFDCEEEPEPDPEPEPEPEPPPDGTPYPVYSAFTVVGPEDDDPPDE